MGWLYRHDVVFQRFRKNGSRLWFQHYSCHVNDHFIDVLLYEVRKEMADGFNSCDIDGLLIG